MQRGHDFFDPNPESFSNNRGQDETNQHHYYATNEWNAASAFDARPRTSSSSTSQRQHHHPPASSSTSEYPAPPPPSSGNITVVCGSCGTELLAVSKFCMNCGERVVAAKAATTAEQQHQPVAHGGVEDGGGFHQYENNQGSSALPYHGWSADSSSPNGREVVGEARRRSSLGSLEEQPQQTHQSEYYYAQEQVENVATVMDGFHPSTTVFPPLRNRGSVCLFGFGGLIVRSSGRDIALTTTRELNASNFVTTRTFRPLLHLLHAREAGEETTSHAAAEALRGFADFRLFGGLGNYEDGLLPGSTKMLFDALVELLRARGRRLGQHLGPGTRFGTPLKGSGGASALHPTATTTTTTTTTTTFEERVIHLLTASPISEYEKEDEIGGEASRRGTTNAIRGDRPSSFSSSSSLSVSEAGVGTVTAPRAGRARPGFSFAADQGEGQKEDEGGAEMEMLLLSGDCESAVLHALERDMWPHALVLANFVSASAYRRVVAEFVSRTLVVGTPTWTVFNLLAGRGVDAVNDEGALDLRVSWRQTLRAVLANRTPNDRRVLEALGDRIWRETKSVSAAHCHGVLEAGGEEDEDARIMLLGGDHLTKTDFITEDAVARTEAYLFACGLSGNNNGNAAALEAFQPFRLVYAMRLCDEGAREEAAAWLASIESCDAAWRGASEENEAFRAQLRQFRARVEGRLDDDATMTPYAFFEGAAEKVVPVLDSLRDMNGEATVDGYNQYQYQSVAPPPSSSFQGIQETQEASSSLPPASSTTTTTTTTTAEADQSRSEHDHIPPNAIASSSDIITTTTITTTEETEANPEFANPFAAAKKKLSAPPLALPSVAPAAIVPRADIRPDYEPPPRKMKEATAAPPPPPNPVSSGNNAVPPAPANRPLRSALGEKISDARGWLVQRLVGVGNAKVANMGSRNEAYYDDNLKRWVFPGEDTNVPPPSLAPPTLSGLSANSHPGGDGGPATAPPAAPPRRGPLGGGGGGGGAVRNRYVVAS